MKPAVYIASPYSLGDPCINTYFQCRIFDELLTDNLVLPIAPIWSHFQHTIFPRPYEDWISYNISMLKLYDACLRLDAEFKRMNYFQKESSGADREVEYFLKNNKPVFYSKNDLYNWVKNTWKG